MNKKDYKLHSRAIWSALLKFTRANLSQIALVIM